MKYALLLGVVMSGVAGIAYLYNPEPVQYQAPEVREVVKEVISEVPELDRRIADALAASSTEIEAAAQREYEERKAYLENEVRLRVTREYRQEIEAQEDALEKENAAY